MTKCGRLRIVHGQSLSDAERWQLETSSYREQVLRLARSSPLFSGAELIPESQELRVFGLGEPPAAVANLVERAPENIRVVWRAAPYSLEELLAEVRRLLSTQRGRVSGIGPRHDGSALLVTTTDRALLESGDPQAILGTVYPVVIEEGDVPVATTDRPSPQA